MNLPLRVDPIVIQEDLANLRVQKSSRPGLPTYELTSKTYSLQKRKWCPFISCNNKYIRKSTALYLLQESFSLSNHRLLRVRSQQPSHVHNSGNNLVDLRIMWNRATSVCLNEETMRINSQLVVWYSSRIWLTQRNVVNFQVTVDLSEDIDNIGGLCNWYRGFIGDISEEMVSFKPLHVFTQGYIPFNELCYKNSR